MCAVHETDSLKQAKLFCGELLYTVHVVNGAFSHNIDALTQYLERSIQFCMCVLHSSTL